MAVTLRDIAQALGVTTTTVHRALQGKPGVSAKTRETVRQKALEMGYRTNYMAAQLKRKNPRLAIAIPEPMRDDRYYYGNLWQGIRQFLSGVGEFGIETIEMAYPRSRGSHGEALREIFEKQGDTLDGLLTMGEDHPQSAFFIEKYAEKRIPVVVLGSDMYKDMRFCCVRADDEMAGSLAAELLFTFGGKAPQKVIATGHFGQLGLLDQHYNVDAFTAYMRENAPHIEVIPIRGEQASAVCDAVRDRLRSDEDISAIYSSSARYTLHMAEVISSLDKTREIRLIGNDFFQESRALLEKGVVSAIIDKKITRQGFLALKTLFDYIIKGEYPPSGTIYVRPEIIMRSNIQGGNDL